MTGDSPTSPRPAILHVPVLAAPIVEHLAPVIRDCWIDCTLGLAGHALALFEHVPASARLIGLDVDPANLAEAGRRLAAHADRVRRIQANFRELDCVVRDAGAPPVDAILADLGVASNQIGEGRYGLSFDQDGPLDMRLDPRLETTAADLVNGLPERELADLLYIESNEPLSRRIAKRICAARRAARITRTADLARVVAQAVGSRRGRIHPATRTFLALRAAVNEEGAALDELLRTSFPLLRIGGRLAIVSFHSGEDRRVKTAFRELARRGDGRLITRRPIAADESESRDNPRARSAKLRIIERADISQAAPPR